MSKFKEKYTDFVVEHHSAIKTAGILALVGDLPIMVGVGATTEVSPPLVGMGVASLGIVAVSLSMAGREIEAYRQQG